MFMLLMMLLIGEEDNKMPHVVRNLIYEAEVYNKGEESLETLRTMLCETTEVDRSVVRAMSIVKFADRAPKSTTSGRSLFEAIQKPNALIFFQNQAYVLAESEWLELGDWIDDYFLLEVNPKRIVLETRSGSRHEISLSQDHLQSQVSGDYCVLMDCEAVHLLPFLAEKAGLNWFKPGVLERNLSGIYSLPDWVTLLDRVCERGDITYTRLGDSVVFRLDNAGGPGTLGVVSRENVSLASFLQDLTQRLDMELYLEEGLADTMITFHAENQSWRETLECLAIAHQFNWSLASQGKERTKLVVVTP